MAKRKARKAKKLAAPKMPFSFKRSLLPPILGLVVMAGVFIVLNSQWLVAQFHYRFREPVAITTQQVVAKGTSDSRLVDINTEPTLIIPKIGVKAPIIFEPSPAEWKVQMALRKGVDHYGTTAKPGQIGNTVIFGHSSGLLWAPGDYKFVFAFLDKLSTGDQIIIDYQNTRYTYTVNSTETILPTNLSVLNQHSSKPVLSLITCTPVGTNKFRLVVHAEQTSPKPLAGAQPVVSTSVRLPAQLPR